MFIKKIVLDGFKSYAKRTEVEGFDPNFNAITGLNGSGKSNILDSICFLLGISNLSQVRASNLQDLIFKKGQAGITKASVTITFDNSDKSQSPIGYEDFDEITITRQIVSGGKNKYLINGCNSSNTRVNDLFCSVQMNVNNPHFLIMQGRITKVLNMKPVEILGMIEEAAGTKMYENKRQSALKTLEKKDLKLCEIQKLLDEDITPNITKLKEERTTYMEYEKVNRELVHHKKIMVAFQYEETKKIEVESKAKMEQTQNKLKSLQESETQLMDQLSNIEKEIEEAQKAVDSEASAKFRSLNETLKNAQSDENKVSASLEIAVNGRDTAKTHLEDLKDKIVKLSEVLTRHEQTFTESSIELEKYKLERDALQKEILAVQENKQSILMGIGGSGENSDKSGLRSNVNEEIAATKSKISDYSLKIEQLHQGIELNTRKLDECMKNLEKAAPAHKNNCQLENKLITEVKKLEKYLESQSSAGLLTEKLSDEKNTLIIKRKDFSRKREDFESKNPNLQFSYKVSPSCNLNSRELHGLVCSLVQVNNSNYTIALECCAGSKLYNVVVDTDETVKKLVKYGSLQRRYTFLALNRIKVKQIDNETIQLARKLTGCGNIDVALSFVQYKKELKDVMSYLFGNTLICETSEQAKLLAFHPKIKKRCVTINGDVFDPSGVLTGGSRNENAIILKKQMELNEITKELEFIEIRINEIDSELAKSEKIAKEYREKKECFELTKTELMALQEKISSSQYKILERQKDSLTCQIESDRSQLNVKENEVKSEHGRLKELSLQQDDQEGYRNKAIKTLTDKEENLKKNLNDTMKNLNILHERIHSLQLNSKECKGELENCQKEIKQEENACTEYESKIVSLESEYELVKSKVSELSLRCEKARNEMYQYHETIEKKNLEKQKKNQEMFNLKKSISSSSAKQRELGDELQNAIQKRAHLIKNNEWIEQEEQFFNVSPGPYDLQSFSLNELKRQIVNLENSTQKLGRNLNTRALDMLSQGEEQYQELLKRLKIVESDREKLKGFIEELDKKKSQTLVNAWKAVNKDFGNIFSSLLPGANARLQPVDHTCILAGLDINVGFGSKWKESLNELSGGQRSLVALSLTLAMLLFKPAPIYILDEVDAALDISHTENIGVMLRKHFQKSQFIVVSLKDGMFTNANVLFRTKFVDGVSTISRYCQNSKSLNENKENHNMHHHL